MISPFSLPAFSVTIGLSVMILTSCGVDKRAVSVERGSANGRVQGSERADFSGLSRREAADLAMDAAARADLEDRVRRFAERERENAAKQERKAAKRAAKESGRTEESGGGLFFNRESRDDRDRGEAGMIPAPRERGGFFPRFGFGKGLGRRGEGEPPIYVDHALLPVLAPSSAEIEISLSEQKARVFHAEGPHRHLVIETPVSTGKAGFETSVGSYQIQEKLEEKKSTLYGTWLDGNGNPVPSTGESNVRPAGGATFVGAEMPYWMRLHGGIGLHVGEVPEYPASHGCIRVPAAVQPLIFSKVDVGTPVTITL